MKYRLVLFDFDGTLADTGDWVAQAMNRAAVRFGFRSTSAAEIEMLRGLPNREILRYLGVPLWKLPRIVMYIRQLATAESPRTKLFPGTREMLARLSAGGVALAVVSSNSEENIRRVLGTDTATLIRYYECGISLFGKAARFKRILKRSGLPAAQALAIGDESRDIDAAKAAGLPSGAVTWGYATGMLLRSCEPTEVFDSVEEIPNRLLSARST
jgi:phosphoglycolate phosphatase